MPVTDWQFWVVSLIALGGLVLVVRQFKPVRRTKTRTNLTIEGRDTKK